MMLSNSIEQLGNHAPSVCDQSWWTGSASMLTDITHSHMRECFKGDGASQWKRPKFDPSPHQNPLTDLHKNWQA